MRTLVVATILCVGCVPGCGAEVLLPGPCGTGAEATLTDKLHREFDTLLQDPNAFADRVRSECGDFPEGDLLPYTLTACAYVQLGLADPNTRPAAIRHVRQLLDLARPGVLKRVKTGPAGLAALRDYQQQAVYLGQYNLALGGYRLLGGKGLADEHKAISDALQAAAAAAKGRPLASYPNYTWTFDTIPCLLSLRVYDRLAGGDRSDAFVAAHLAWLADRATQPATGMPYSRVDEQTGKSVAAPRGCELSWRLALLADLDPNSARQLYAKYVRSFWLDRGLVAGFAEWPGGKDREQDLDSGPIIMGIGSAATTFGIAAAAAGEDPLRRARLICQAARGKTLLKQLNTLDPKSAKARTLSGRIDPQSEYVTGFLFGDACLFYAVTWRQWLADAKNPEK